MASPCHNPREKEREEEEEEEEEEEDNEEMFRLGDVREEETIGIARRRAGMAKGGDDKDKSTSSGNSSAHAERSSSARLPRNARHHLGKTSSNRDRDRTSATTPAVVSKKARVTKVNNRVGGRGGKGAAAADGGSGPKASKKNGSAVPRSRGSGVKKKRACRTKTSSKKVSGLLGIPVAWDSAGSTYDDSEDSDYGDSESESYYPSTHKNSSSPAGGAGTRSARRGLGQSKSSASKAPTGRGRARATGKGGGEMGGDGVDRMKQLSAEVMLDGIIRPYLCPGSKCALQRSCREMRRLLNAREAWENLDLRAEVIGRRTMKSGRQSIMSSQPLFFLARSVVQQPRFELLRSVDLRGLNLGAMGSTPDLLVTLFDACRHITTLNLLKTYLEEEGMPQPDSSVEKVIAQRLPGVRHLALEIDSSNKGLKVLLEGCTSLKSLHIGTRSNRRGDSISMYPNDLGMKAFTTVGAPSLETFSLVDKVDIGAAGLRSLLDVSSCPRLKDLILVRTGRVNDHCLKSIAPSMGRLSSLVLSQCPVKPSTIQLVLESCLELTRVTVATQLGLVDQPQAGRGFLEYLTARAPAALSKVDLQVVAPREPCLGGLLPRWLAEDIVLHTAVLDCSQPHITFGPTETWDERIAPYMAGRRS